MGYALGFEGPLEVVGVRDEQASASMRIQSRPQRVSINI
jgi:hypothetical protein